MKPQNSLLDSIHRAFSIATPLLAIGVAVGLVRFGLSVMHAPRGVVYAASLTAVELIGSVVLAFRVGRHHQGRFTLLWLANLMLFGTCQILYLAGIGYTAITGIPTLFHETERLNEFLGYTPSLALHAWFHFQNWMIIAPTIVTIFPGLPIMWICRLLPAPGR